MRLFIFGGTTEGRELAEQLCRMGHEVTVSCATELGAEQLAGISCRVLCGRMDVDDMAETVKGTDLVIDATHPYAVEVTENIVAACEAAGVRRVRVLRAASTDPSGETYLEVRDCAEAAEKLEEISGNILLTTGSKELERFNNLDPNRLFVRVLPTVEAITLCERMQIPHRNILALQGPFSEEMNKAMLRQYDIHCLVTKDGGRKGGFPEKISAAASLGIRILVIGRPADRGLSMGNLLKVLQQEDPCMYLDELDSKDN